MLGRTHEAMGGITLALKAYEDAVRTNPNPHGWWYTGMNFTKEAKEAIKRLKRKKK
ncbi:MAG: hypothetical protein GF308_06900 [Candidatus Heimdallarchaeota archaeon]|nr:hypothetical protein [Candidatus Heimdallarchaeota archaeon]